MNLPSDASSEPSSSRRRLLSEIFLVSCSMLFLELSLIRWLPANIYSLAFFANLVLLAAFYGFGVGTLCGGLGVRLLKAWPFYLLAFVAAVVLLREFDVLIPADSAEWIWSRFRGDQITKSKVELPLELVLTCLFFAVALLFVPLGQRLAQLMEGVENLSFYSFDLLGSLVGVLLFSILSGLGTPPAVWFGVTLLLVLPLLVSAFKRAAWWLAIPVLLAIAIVSFTSKGERWSPYYSILTRPTKAGFAVFVNRLYHQEAIGLQHREIPGYLLPYQFFKGGDVLVVGAGTGNDIAVALRHGAASVTAVEIDPTIRRLGNAHPLHPYADPRVSSEVQDARSYLQTSDRSFDLIVFGTLDSHALLSSVSNVRLDNYVYTVESLQAAHRRLKPDGKLAMLYSVPTENGKLFRWIRDRLVGMAQTTFGENHALAFDLPSSYLNLVVVAQKGGAFGPEWGAVRAGPPKKETILPHDDWPFLYMEFPTIPSYHLVVIATTLCLGLIPVLLLLPRGRRRLDWNFFLLGMGFMLLETAAITRMALLFGSTWIVNTVVFFGVLLMVLLANLIVQRGLRLSMDLVYAGIVASVLLTYFVDVQLFLYSSIWIRMAIALLLTGLPVFFAGLAFSKGFADRDMRQVAFGSNLLGAFFGGFCEYLGMITGLHALLLLVVCCYLGSFLLSRRQLASAG